MTTGPSNSPGNATANENFAVSTCTSYPRTRNNSISPIWINEPPMVKKT